jgi:hypothetical protein
MTWCCGVFKGWWEVAGERGIAILVDRELDGTPAFMIQSRSVDSEDEGPKTHPRPLTLIAELHIQCCPWCGRRLLEVYRDSIDALARPELRFRRL